jgi:hypothetical protein
VKLDRRREVHPLAFSVTVTELFVQDVDYGLVGGVLDDGTLVVTPNMQVLCCPFTGFISVCLQHDFRFGKEDPFLHPQPLVHGFEHLSVLPLPSNALEAPLAVMFQSLDRFDFVHTTQDLFASSRHLLLQIHRKFLDLAGSLIDQIEHHGCNSILMKDPILLKLRYLVLRSYGQTHLPGTRDTICMQFALAQRTYLELKARADWLLQYSPCVTAATMERHAVKTHLVRAIIEDRSQMEALHRAGILVWLQVPVGPLGTT